MTSTVPSSVRPVNPRRPRPRLERLAPLVSIAALVVLSFILGAAVLHFDLPPAGFLERAFIGGRRWAEQQAAEPEYPAGQLAGAKASLLRPGDAFEGYTLVTTNQAPEAL